MQDPETDTPTTNTKHRRYTGLIVTAVFVLLLLGLSAFYVGQTRSYKGRDCGMPTPWEGEGLTVNTVSAHWESAADDARMALRSGQYPVARIKLGDCKGSGLMYISFRDIYGRQVGDTINLHYRDGKLVHRDESWVRTTDDTAVCRIETGYQDPTELEQHFLNQNEPLWRVVVKYRPDGEERPHTLGYACVQPELRKETAE